MTVLRMVNAQTHAPDLSRVRLGISKVSKGLVGACLAAAVLNIGLLGVTWVSVHWDDTQEDIVVRTHIPALVAHRDEVELAIHQARPNHVAVLTRSLSPSMRGYLMAQVLLRQGDANFDRSMDERELKSMTEAALSSTDAGERAQFDPKVLVRLEQAAFGKVVSPEAKAFMEDLANQARAAQERRAAKIAAFDPAVFLWRAFASLVLAGMAALAGAGLTKSSQGTMAVNKLVQLATAPAHWVALCIGAGVLALTGLGLIGAWGFGLAAVGYGLGWGLGIMWMGNPLREQDEWQALSFKDEGDARQSMAVALAGVRRLTEHNPENKIPSSLSARVMGLCGSLEELLHQWERSRSDLALQDSFDARHIAITYLPDALNSFLAIPARYSGTLKLDNGMTAVQTFEHSLKDLETRTEQLARDLAQRDAQAFVNHSEFLSRKFAPLAPAAASLKLEER